MRRRTSWFALVLTLLLVFPAAVARGDGTLLGTVSGKVVDESGGALPGVTVEVVSVDKGFQRSLTTDATGSFKFPLLQPGPYTVRASLSGFQPSEATNNIVAPDKTTSVTITMRIAATKESVVVTGDTPLVDKTNVSATTTVSSTLTQKLPVGRSYQSLVTFAPGVNSTNNSGNPNSHGALSGNNLYLFDGVDTTDVTTGTFGQNFNYEAIQEVDVSTTGISAEYGRAQGAVINVITKSGTNQFQGSVKLLLTNDNWNEQNKGSNPSSGASFARVKFDQTIKAYAYTLGGPVWKDHLWLFGAYETVNNTSPQRQTATSTVHPNQTGQNYQQTTNVRLWDGKLTFQATPSHFFTGQFNSDPISGFVVNYWGGVTPAAERKALTSQDQNACSGIGCLKQARYSGVFGSKVSFEAAYAQQSGSIFVRPFEGNGSPFFSNSDNLFYNGATFDGFVERPRKQANLAINIYQELFGSSHQFKAGVDYQDLKSVASFAYPTNQVYYVADFDPTKGANQTFVRGDELQKFTDPQPSVSKGKILGFYALDKFSVGRVSLNLGARVEKQTADSDIGNTVIDTTRVSPRVSGAYDILGNGKTLASVGYGRYYQFLLQSIADSIFSGVPQQANKDVFIYDGTRFVFDHSVREGGNTQPVNRDLRPSYLDEINVAVQQQIGNTMAVGVRGIYRKWKDLVDDRKFISAGNNITTPENFDSDLLRRDYRAIELTFEKRFSQRWQALANYTLSRARGNQFANFSSQLFDFAGRNCTVTGVGTLPCDVAASTNQFGLAAYDRTHVVNIFAGYTLPLSFANITAAPSFYYTFGLPFQRQRTFPVPSGARYNYFFDERGSSRLSSIYQLDFALEATFKPFGSSSPVPLVGGPIELGVKGEVFNLTNQQKTFRTDLISLLPNSAFGTPTSRNAQQAPRGYRLTALLRF